MALKPGQGRNPGENMAYNTNRKPPQPPAPSAPPAPPTPQGATDPEQDSLIARSLRVGATYALAGGTASALETTRQLVGERAALIGAAGVTVAAILTELAAPNSAAASMLAPAGHVAFGAGLAVPLTQKVLEKSGLGRKRNQLTAEEMRRQIRVLEASTSYGAENDEEGWMNVPAKANQPQAARS